MSQIERILLSLLMLFCLSSQQLNAQLFPGDANNDGLVDHYDVLAIGYAYGTVGPARIESGTEPNVQGIPIFWQTDFPNGDNYAYADTDGNGQIEVADFSAVYQNYGNQWVDNFVNNPPSEGVPGDPRLGLGSENQMVSLLPGQGISLPILLGSMDQELVDLNGLAFKIRFSTNVFANLEVDLSNNWLAENAGQAIQFQQPQLGQIDIGLSRFGVDPLTGSGSLGSISFIVVEDMIDLLPEPYDTISTCLYIEGILGLDGMYDTIPILADSLCINLYHPDAILSDEEEPLEDAQVLISPNPLKDRFSFWSDHAFHRLELIDMQGRSQTLYRGEKRRRWRGANLQLPPGCYAIRMYAEEGVLTRKLMIQ